MLVDFPYPLYEGMAPVHVPDERLLGVWAPRVLQGVDETAEIHRGLAQPIAAPPLPDAVRGKQNVLILMDDGTRGTPTARLLPHVLAQLDTGGIPLRRIKILTAQGTHRRMNDAELRKKLGDYFGRVTVHQHDWKDASRLHHFGTLRDGTPVRANALLAEADFILGIGGIVPHRVKGYYSATMAVQTGGTIIMVSPNPEGVAGNHPNLLQIGYRKHAELVALVQSGQAEDLVGLAILADVAQIIDQARCMLVSPGISPAEAQKLGLIWEPDAQTALDKALADYGPQAKVAVLKHGGHILPLADRRALAALETTL